MALDVHGLAGRNVGEGVLGARDMLGGPKPHRLADVGELGPTQPKVDVMAKPTTFFLFRGSLEDM